MEHQWVVSPSPHLRSPESTTRIMWQVAAALAPAGAWSVYQWGWSSVGVIVLAVATAVIVEAAIQKFRGVRVTVYDGSAVVTGLLLAYVLPAEVVRDGQVVMLPWYVPVVGSAFGIGVVKQAFGGLGFNIWNPALAARAFVQVAWQDLVSLPEWVVPTAAPVDGMTAATPLAVAETPYSVMDLFLGTVPGSLGEVSALLLLIGGAYLIAREYVDWRLPLGYLAAVAVLALVLPPKDVKPWSANVLYEFFAAGVIIGAFFMATDMVTSPLTRWGQLVFGVGCGVLTVLIRFYTGYPEGVCYSILLMNTARPLIDRYTRPRVYGEQREKTS